MFRLFCGNNYLDIIISYLSMIISFQISKCNGFELGKYIVAMPFNFGKCLLGVSLKVKNMASFKKTYTLNAKVDDPLLGKRVKLL